MQEVTLKNKIKIIESSFIDNLEQYINEYVAIGYDIQTINYCNGKYIAILKIE
jgi:hypothetical protein